MSINEEFTNLEPKKEEKVETRKKKISNFIKTKKFYLGVLTTFLVVLVAVGTILVYRAFTYVVGCFTDYSMAPTINKVIKNEEGKEYTYENFRDRDGNIVNYGLIEPVKSKPTFKRFEVVVTRIYEDEFFFNPFRLIGFPGETIKLDYHGNLFVNGIETTQPIKKEYLKMDWSDYKNQSEDQLYFETTLGEDEYYLLKDNRFYYENDSRTRGGYKYKNIYGTVKAIQGTCEIQGSSFINLSFPVTRFI